MQFSLRKLFVVASIICVVAAAIGFAYSLQSRIQFSYRGNAISWVGLMVVRHLENNNDQWPSSWKDLEDDYAPVVRKFGQPWTFEGLKENVEIDWAFDSASIGANGIFDRTRQPLKVTVQDPIFDDRQAEANATVFDYLNSQLNQ